MLLGKFKNEHRFNAEAANKILKKLNLYKQAQNIYLILMAAAIATDSYNAFKYAHPFLQQILPEANIEPDFAQVKRRTDPNMRSLFELCLHAGIVTCNEDICLEVLRFGRVNTFLMVIH